MPAIRHYKIDVDGLQVFVREAGEPTKPTVILLPGYPSSTRAYVRLIDRLAPDWHVAAIDYPGFGSSDPLPESPTFDRLAEVTGKAIEALGIGDYAIYMFDFGSPVGFRIALKHDQRVRAVVTQNGNAYAEGFGPGVAPLAAWWKDREGGQAPVDAFVSLIVQEGSAGLPLPGLYCIVQFTHECADEVDRRAVQGGAAKTLLEESASARMLVLGSRGYGGFTGLLLGSVMPA